MDVVALAQLGFPNAVATLGTACTADHVQKLFRFTDSVVFSFDGDEAGRRAARKALDGALPYATDVRTREVPVPAGRARPGQLHPRVRPGGFRPLRPAGRAARAPSWSRLRAKGCDLGTAEGRVPHGQQRRAAVEAAARRRAEAPVAGEICRAGRSSASTSCWSSGALAQPGASPGPQAASRAQEPVSQARVRQRHAARRSSPRCSRPGRAHRDGWCCATPAAWDVLTDADHDTAVRAAGTAGRSVRLARQPASTSTAASPGPPCSWALAGQPFAALAAPA